MMLAVPELGTVQRKCSFGFSSHAGGVWCNLQELSPTHYKLSDFEGAIVALK